MTAALPWDRAALPAAALSIYHQDASAVCWACGCPRRVTPPPPPDGASRALRACGQCRVATYCSPACAAAHCARGAGATGGRATGGRPTGFSVLPLLRGAAPPSSPDGSATSVREALFPVTSIDPRALAGPEERWLWPPAVADRAEEMDLVVADVVTVIDPPSWSLTLIPAAEYVHWPAAVPAATLARLLRHDGGTVLRVVVRSDPPRVHGFGPHDDRDAYT